MKQAVRMEPNDAPLHYQLGQAYLKAGQRPEAERELAAAQKLQAAAFEKQEELLSGRLPPPPVRSNPVSPPVGRVETTPRH